MAEDQIEIWERIYFDKQNRATHWLMSWDKGKTWGEVDCALYPDGKPPFVRIADDVVEWVERHLLRPTTSSTDAVAESCISTEVCQKAPHPKLN